MDELKKLRNDLDMCDEILIDALRMRCQIIQEITNYKQKNGLPIYQPMLMPGEQIGTREIARIREDWKLGLTVEGICEKSDKLDLWIEVVI